MNTPKPCNECNNLYFDCLQEDDPSYTCECKLGLPIGEKTCKSFEKLNENELRELMELAKLLPIIFKGE